MNISRRECKIIAVSIVLTVAALGVIAASAAGIFIQSGTYDISAGRPHWTITQIFLTHLKRRSVETYADDRDMPDLNDPGLIKQGFQLYREQCVACHGAPGEPRQRIGLGLNPNPPPLLQAADSWRPYELAWIISNGLKMAGMPAFGFGQPKENIWALTAFVVRMQTLTPMDYLAMEGDLQNSSEQDLTLFASPKLGWDELERRSDVAQGKLLVQSYGCHRCHDIEDVSHAQSTSASSLHNFRDRHYIAGRFLNEPYNLVDWIKDPTSFDPQTAMPELDVTTSDAWAIASYLYQLE